MHVQSWFNGKRPSHGWGTIDWQHNAKLVPRNTFDAARCGAKCFLAVWLARPLQGKHAKHLERKSCEHQISSPASLTLADCAQVDILLSWYSSVILREKEPKWPLTGHTKSDWAN